MVRLTEDDCWALTPMLGLQPCSSCPRAFGPCPQGQLMASALPQAPAVMGCSGLQISSLLPKW
jgi:hypothetical protein